MPMVNTDNKEITGNINYPHLISLDVVNHEKNVLGQIRNNIETFSFEYVLPEFSDALVSILEKLNKLYPIKINYSIGKSQLLQLYTWTDFPTFMEVFNTDEKFIASMDKCGEIHVSFVA
jgi:hypothetical protein